MSTSIAQEYVSIGGNRHSGASCWSPKLNVLAFGADQNIAIWDPLNIRFIGIQHLLHGHKDKVTAVTFLTDIHESPGDYLLSGSADGKLFLWTCEPLTSSWQSKCEKDAHQGALNCITGLAGTGYIATGGADARIKLWKVRGKDLVEVVSILPTPRMIPLTLVLGPVPHVGLHEGFFLAAGGTRNDIKIYAVQNLSQTPSIEQQATLVGHEGWVRSLSLRVLNEHELLLASASHDKYVRLWKFQHGDANISQANADAVGATSLGDTLTAKTQTVKVAGNRCTITFEALLLGHEDWVYSVAWNPASGSEQLLTASADGSLTIWELDPASGIWISTSRLGEISGQKGATTATGSSGGFWVGHWSPDGQSVICLGRTGSWRVWRYDRDQQYWTPRYGIGGHTGAVNGLTWSLDGGYLLSTGSDQTTRLHAEWQGPSMRSWHEFARPQIHGYDLNCISSTGYHQFVSGADEKLLRVFSEPRDIAKMLKQLCRIQEPEDTNLSELAAMPVLGLSNKAMEEDEGGFHEANGSKTQEYVAPDLDISLLKLEEPPTEDLLSRHTLWPEHEKLYGHGYEISESAYSSAKQVLATACKASSTDHAVIRLYDTNDWSEIKPPLTAHSLTVTRLTWSPAPHNYLLSVGRDRQWTIFKMGKDGQGWTLMQAMPKAHSRMILDAAWSPLEGKLFFATAGRDKSVKLWHGRSLGHNTDPKFEEQITFKQEAAVTALSFTCNRGGDRAILAVGEESGALSIHVLNIDQHPPLFKSTVIEPTLCPSKAVTRVSWKKNTDRHSMSEDVPHLAVASSDGSIRVLSINVEALCRV